jgi:Ni/Co efflux regulator RcnB
MSQNLEFRITASDQASRVVASVQKKVTDFGKDIGQSIVAIAGPMALASMAISKISQKMEEAKQRSKEAFDWGSGLSKSARQMGVSVTDFQRIESAAADTGMSVTEVGDAFKAANNLIQQAKQGNLAAAESLATMGFNLMELDKIKPEDVIRRIGEAMATAEDPADKLKIAIGALGKEGEKLQGILAKGFDIAGAFKAKDGLSDAEQDFLAKSDAEARGKANRQRLIEARRGLTEKFLEEDPAGQRIVAAERAKLRGQMGVGAGMPGGGSIGGVIGVGTLSKSDQIQNEVQRILAERAAAAVKPPTAEAVSAAGGLIAKAEEDAKPPAAKLKPDKVAPSPSVAGMEFSSLRAIGGAMAGDSSIRGTEEERTEIARQIRDRLDKLIEQNQPSIDFTKNIGRAFAPIGRIFNK